MVGFRSNHSSRRIPILVCASCWFVHFHVSTAVIQASEYVAQSWQRQHGLPENMVKALCQTRDSYLWIGTYSGLARFDGLKFTVFNHVNLPGLPSDVCKTLAEDGEGNLWIGTDNGLVRWRDQTLDAYTTEHGLNDNDIRLLCVGQQNRLWIATSEGLHRFSEGKLTRLTAQDGLKLNFVSSMYEDPSGALWVSTSRGVQRWNPVTTKFEDCVNYDNLDANKAAIGFWSNCHIRGSAETLWMGRVRWPDDEFNGLSLLGCAHEPALVSDALVRGSQAGLLNYTNESGVSAGNLQFLLPDHLGNVWLATERGGLVQFRDGKFARYDKAHGLTDGSLMSLLEDREGNLWIGTRNGGLNRLRSHAFQAYSTDDGLPHEKAWTMCERHDGGVWLGTDGGVTLWQDGLVTNYMASHGLTGTTVRSLHEDREGTLWIGTGNGLFSLQQGKVASHQLMTGHAMHKIRVVNSDRAGNLWVGWEHGLLQLTNGVWRNFTTNDDLAHNDVRAVLEDRHGALWLGTFGGGLNRWHEGKVTVLTTKDGLASDFAWTLYEDAEGILWIGTEGGLSRLSLSSSTEERAGVRSRIFSYTTREGLFDNLINQILEDDRGNLWLSCDRGIFRVSKQELNAVAEGKAESVQSVVYSEADGLLSAETNGRKSQPAGCTTRDGRLWFPTAKGVAVVDPAKLDSEEIPPPVVIEEVQANGQPIFSNSRGTGFSRFPIGGEGRGERAPGEREVRGEDTREWSQIVNRKSEIHLPPGGARLLTFQYTANCLAAPEKVRFKYRLLGSHSDWIEASTRRAAHFTDLRPGHYRFQVIACNQHGVWNETGASLAFYLAPFFYQTWWFYAVCAALIGFSGWALLRWRMNELRKIQALEGQTGLSRELARISHDLHDALGSTLTREAHLITQAQRALGQPSESKNAPHPSSGHPPHEHPSRPPPPHPALSPGGGEGGVSPGEGASDPIRQHLESLQHASGDARQTLKEIIWATNPSCDTLEHLVSYICQYASQYLEPTGIRCRFDVPVSLLEREIPAATRHHFFLTAKEALHNIVRHANATEVWIRAATDNSTLRLSIEDNGCGFAPQLHVAPKQRGGGSTPDAQPLTPMNREHALNRQPADRGNGLPNMRQRIHDCGGRFALTSAPGQGTKIQIEIPLR
jgi:ligand-binding sensor domain-containing protein/signal transduction histidine kinase